MLAKERLRTGLTRRGVLLLPACGFGTAMGADAERAGRDAAAAWPALTERSLEVDAGSVLDFSSLVEAGPAGRHGWARALDDGHIGFEKRATPQRFFSASFQFAPGNGGFPERGEARRMVTQLVRTGYNAVRLQCVEQQLMSGQKQDFDFQPEQFDRFQFLLAELKRQGVYTVIDVAYIDNGAYGGVFPHRWVRTARQFRRDLLAGSDEARDHWKRLLQRMLGQRNPHTGTVPLQDPSLLCLVFSNEGGLIELAFRAGGGWNAALPEVYAEPFRAWLAKRYPAETDWRRAWGGEAGADESLATRVRLPARLRVNGVRQRDFMRFVIDAEQEAFRWQFAFAQSLGYRGLATSYNNWSWLQSDITRSALPVVDQHAYHAHPTGFVEPGAFVPGESSLPGAAAYLRELFASRQWGKPFMVTEYGHAFWNGFRREASALAPAYAALQGWDLLTQFSENSLQLSTQAPQPSRRSAIFPFTISTDPVRRTGERLAALLYARGDVAPARRRLEFRVDAQAALDANGAWSQLGDGPGRLGLVSAVGLGFGREPASARVVMDDVDDFMVDKSRVGYQVLSALGARGLRRRLESAGAADAATLAAFERGRYVSDTGELQLDTSARRFSVDTPRTVALLTASAPDAVGLLSLQRLSVPALVAASSMDGRALSQSRHILLFVITDANNTGIEFQDEARTRLRKLGTLPALVQPVQITLRLALSGTPGALRLHSLSQSGRRLQALPVRVDGATVQCDIDTAALSSGPSLMFELTSE
ncbi:hypothetical protein PEC18_20690 [Paucibacter sp. O1-1]|nr:hypothetical protein [Paucibacter sp. O1-1]MDA3828170.1 hypothetical protein [Paucibacter sp. O1-1]